MIVTPIRALLGGVKMNPLGKIRGTHKIVILQVPERLPATLLCLHQKDSNGSDAYYVLAECEGKALKWRSMIKENSVRRLKDEFVDNIVEEQEIDQLDVETIFFCSAEASKT